MTALVLRRLAIAGAAAVVLAVTACAATARPFHVQGGVLDAVEWIAGPSVSLRCTDPVQGQFEALGHADREHRVVELAPRLCRRLDSLVSAPAAAYSAASYTQAQAVLVLVHESVHLSAYEGSTDEALTECRALQLVDAAALMLGVDHATARALGHEALRYDAQLPGSGNWMVGLHEIPSYHSPDCHDGGSLDIHPRSHDWPN